MTTAAKIFGDAQPTNYIWVAAGALAGGDGSRDHPLNTIQEAVDLAGAGTAVMVTAGEYHENVQLPTHSQGTATAPTWLVSADGPGAAKIVAPSDHLSAIYGYGTDNFVVKGFLIEGGNNGIQFSQSGSNFTNMVQNIVVEDNVIENTKADGIKIDHAANVQIVGNITHHTGQEGIDFVAVNDSLIAYNDVSDASGAAGIMVKGGSTTVAVEANSVHDIPIADGILVGGWTGDQFFVPGFTGYEAKNVTVVDNDVHDVAKRPLNFLGAIDSRASHNYLGGNPDYYTAVNVDEGNPAAREIAHSSNIEIDHNIIANKFRLTVSTDSSAVSFHDNTMTGVWDQQTGPAAFLAREAPWQPVDRDNAANSVSEGAAGGTLVGITASSGDMAGNGLAYALLDNAGGRFAIDAATGIVTVANGALIDFETATGHDIVVQVSDGTLTSSQTFSIAITNVAGVKITGTGAGDFVDATRTVAGQSLATAEEDCISGAAGNDKISGLGGDDTLDGGIGADTMIGGLGNDSYFVGSSGDIVIENANEGTDTVLTLLGKYALAADLENLTYIGTASFTGAGNSFDNHLAGGIGKDVLDGGIGADTLVGGLDNDIYIVDNAGDLVIENSGEGRDTIKTILNAYTLNSGVDNLAYTGSGNFGGTGNALANSIQSSSGSDTLDGGEGADTLTGGGGNDLYIVDNAGDAVVEKSGNGIDTVQTNLSTYVLAAQIEKLVYTGGGNFHATGNLLANDIAGAAGNDTINGGSGNDTINGGGGMDSLTGGVGNDVFVFHSGETNGDTIADFTSGVDRLQFAGFGPGSTLTQTNATDWVITDGVDHHAETIHVANHPVIHAGDFMFL